MQKYLGILKTKLYKPPLTSEHLVRTRLIESIEKNIYKPLTLICAPAGYGKSMLMSSFLDSSNRPYVWVSLDSDLSDIRLFLEYLSAGINEVFPNSMDNILNYLEGAELPPQPVIEQTLLNSLDNIREDFIVVLDDYHLIDGESINILINSILEFPPPNLHLVILSRRDPSLDYVSLRAYNLINELRMSDLTFFKSEIAELFKMFTSLELEDRILDKLLEITEGWVVGLRLTTLSIKSPKEVEEFLGRVSGNFQMISEFLIAEVIEKQPIEIRNLLVETSVLNRFCPELIDSLHQDRDPKFKSGISGKDFSKWLVSSNLFTVSLDNNNEWFRYHHLFQGLLRKRLQDTVSENDIKSLHSNASRWFTENGYIIEAIRHANMSGNEEQATNIVLKNHMALTKGDKWYLVERWMEELPKGIIENYNRLLLLKSWAYFYKINFVGMQECLSSINRNLLTSDNESVIGEIDFFNGYISFFSANGPDSEKYFESAVNKISRSYSHALGESELHYGLAMQMNGKDNKAFDFLTKKIESAPTSDMFRHTRLNASIFFMSILSLNIDRALKHGKIVENIGKKYDSFYAESWGKYIQAISFINCGKFDEALPLFEWLISRPFLGHSWVELDSFSSMLIIFELTNQQVKLNETKVKLKDYLATLGGGDSDLRFNSIEARLMLLRGDKKGAVDLLANGNLEAPDILMLWWTEIPCITEVSVLIAESSEANLLLAVDKLTKWEEGNRSLNHKFRLVTILVLLTSAYLKQEEYKLAIQSLEKAIELSKLSKFVLPFIENYHEISPLLENISPNSTSSIFIKQILENYSSLIQKETQIEIPTIGYISDSIKKLSDRETEILQLLANGLKNKEIADKLFLSHSTIKGYMYKIYKKLKVSTRSQAVQKINEFNGHQ